MESKLINEFNISSLQKVRDRRNGTTLYSGIIDGVERMVKVGDELAIRFEELQKKSVAEQGHQVAKTINCKYLSTGELVIVEDKISSPMLIDSILDDLETGRISEKICTGVLDYFSHVKYENTEYSKEMDPFIDIDSLKKFGEKGTQIISTYGKLTKLLNLKSDLALSHGDLTPFNISKNFTLIDYEDVGNYPIGFDIISFFYSHTWFPKESDNIEGLFRLYEISEETNHKVNDLLTKIRGPEPLIEELKILRGIWHLIGAQDSKAFLSWRVNKILDSAKSIGLI